MHDFDVHEAVYLSCEIRVSWARGLGPLAELGSFVWRFGFLHIHFCNKS
jgi:hypothetical protein